LGLRWGFETTSNQLIVKLILIDAHVHIYDCFDLARFLDSAYANFEAAAKRLGHSNDFTGVLLLAETSKDKWFLHLAANADGKDLPVGKNAGSWTFFRTTENCSLCANSKNSKKLFIVAGHQVVSAEGLEVLALVMKGKFQDGIPISQLIKDIKKNDGLPVIPWGFGKWLGRRGKILEALIENANKYDFFLGDNGGRPKFFHRPSLFKLSERQDIRIIPGTDPLPLKTDNDRVGSFGFGLRKFISNDEPAKDILKCLLDPTSEFEYFGLPEGFTPFLCNQLKLRLKQHSKT
jgi:hypothetical protein